MKLRRRHSTAFGLFYFKLSVQIQALQRVHHLLGHLLRRSGRVQQRTHRHVAADAGKRI